MYIQWQLLNCAITSYLYVYTCIYLIVVSPYIRFKSVKHPLIARIVWKDIFKDKFIGGACVQIGLKCIGDKVVGFLSMKRHEKTNKLYPPFS
jgi:hypothetical protein